MQLWKDCRMMAAFPETFFLGGGGVCRGCDDIARDSAKLFQNNFFPPQSLFPVATIILCVYVSHSFSCSYATHTHKHTQTPLLLSGLSSPFALCSSSAASPFF